MLGNTGRVSMFIAALIGPANHLTAAAAPALYSLGIAPNGSVGSRALEINESGQVAMTSFTLLGEGIAGRYDGVPGAGGVLRELVPLAGYQRAFAEGINSNGQVAGYMQVSSASSRVRAFRYDGTPGAGGTMRDLGTLGGTNSEAFAVNNLGQVTGYADADPNGATPGTFAFLYTGTPGAGGVMHNLKSIDGLSSVGVAINDAGQVAGTSATANGARAFRFDGPPETGVMHNLGVLTGFATSRANAMNASGHVVGAIETADQTIGHAFIYRGTPGVDGVMTDLGVPFGGTVSSAEGINDAGFVVGISDDGSNFLPTLWRPDGSSVNLDAWLDAVDPALGTNWDLKNAFITDINNTGQITGDAVFVGPGPDQGRSFAIVLNAGALLPEPGAIALLAASCLAFARRHRR